MIIDKEIRKFINQIECENVETKYNSGVVAHINGEYLIGYEQLGARDAFSVGQPVYDENGRVMGYLGVGLYENLNYYFDCAISPRIPVEYWRICLPTKYCKEGKQIFTYWQNKERSQTEKESEDI